MKETQITPELNKQKPKETPRLKSALSSAGKRGKRQAGLQYFDSTMTQQCRKKLCYGFRAGMALQENRQTAEGIAHQPATLTLSN